ncbi:sugar phosphate isomerase/epimerase and 4-hydroxyphenylpyruvate domain-containing protein [Streptomyces sp. HNM0575]|uniref:sugar phosphate isomerase/epimerase and 4-hydroxyphenylpyruvate domain-containing protein n=1 Tax=Streptomyces sp. HNM0575 TaxID=2716338 RepID=UPI00145E91FB|nr:sugar phosphate isomerase/epimerase and 4-hydroxyphenylpyruvate domain-containing protein [Streptomyces sp. HNM0575]NLU76760.1 sugar phosphate isomerase/epimerase and 4-hydroxyphenylpyruvate domain-containing protein [Streptomyces sp. HNM0575]
MLEDKLRAAASAGFDGVEIFENDLVVSAMSPESVRSLCADLGLTVDLYQPFRDFEAVPEELHAAGLRRAERKFDLMERLGADTMLVCSTLSPYAVDDDGLAAHQLRALAERASARGIRVAYEALAWGRFVNSWEHSWQIVRRADHPALGLCLDSFHVLSRDPEPTGIDTVDADKLFFLQLADAPRLDMDVLQWSRHHRLFPGQGSFDLPDFLAQVLAAGYDGPLSLEVFNDVFRQTDPGPAALDAMRSLVALEEAVCRRVYGDGCDNGDGDEHGNGDGCEHGQMRGRGHGLEGEPLRGGGRRRIRPTAPPPAPELLGHAFVELAVDEESAPRITAALTALGFLRTGRHRSKPVELWQQGGSDVVLNLEGAARGEAGGTGEGGSREAGSAEAGADVSASDRAEVVALAVESRDPGQSARRAETLLATPLPRRRGPGEAELTAVAAPDGTQLFFCPGEGASGPDWRADFVPVEAVRVDAAPSDAAPGETVPVGAVPADPGPGPSAADSGAGPGGLTRIDHVALAQPNDQFAGSMTFYQSVLDLRERDFAEYAAPFGLVRSHTVGNASGGVRIAMHGALLRRGGWAPSVPDPEHIAFTARDVFAAARRSRARGLELLPITGNYYDDLDARYAPDPQLLSDMRELNILYDRDEHGEFFHFCTGLLGSRVFFEVVQRVGGYRGDGAANAPVRMAAHRQARAAHG